MASRNSLDHSTKSGGSGIPPDFANEQKLKFLNFPPKGTYICLFYTVFFIFLEANISGTYLASYDMVGFEVIFRSNMGFCNINFCQMGKVRKYDLKFII